MFVIKKKNEKNKTIFHYNKPSRSCDDEIYRQRYYLMVSQRFARSDNIYSLFFFQPTMVFSLRPLFLNRDRYRKYVPRKRERLQFSIMGGKREVKRYLDNVQIKIFHTMLRAQSMKFRYRERRSGTCILLCRCQNYTKFCNQLVIGKVIAIFYYNFVQRIENEIQIQF